MKEQQQKVIITCEHGANQIPSNFRMIFAGAEADLASYRGYDLGALELFQLLAPYADFSLSSSITRLLVDLNRSDQHPKLFSEYVQVLSSDMKQQILHEFYYPYQQKIQEQVRQWVQEGFFVLHISIHSFTPVLNGKERKTDIGLLYDPRRVPEVLFSANWRQKLQLAIPPLKVRYNYPFKGTADGIAAQFRKQFSMDQYAGIDLELNQAFLTEDHEGWELLKPVLIKTFQASLQP